jgi:uncharacterized Ntn-hydrolase superfamily protein
VAGDDSGRTARLLVVTDEGAYEGGSDEYADLRVDDHLDPVLELGRLYDIRELHFNLPDAAAAIDLSGPALAEVKTLLDRVGYVPAGESAVEVEAALERWAIDEFLSRRLLPGRVDPVLLGELRRRAGAAWAYA